MKSLLRKLLIDNWQRKLIAVILSMIVWMVVNHSMTVTKTFHDIPIKVINIPPGKTIEGLKANSLLKNSISLTITGNKNVLDSLTSSDLEVMLDALGKGNEWVAKISKKNLISFNPDIDINKSIKKITHQDFIIKLCKLVTERVPIIITDPVGELPKGYQFIDITPNHLYITVSGPEDIVKELKSKARKLTFNLSSISFSELKTAEAKKPKNSHSEVSSFYIPNSWKKMTFSNLSDQAIEIDDPEAKHLRINFSKTSLIPLKNPIQIQVYYPEKYINSINPTTHSLEVNTFIQDKKGLKLTTPKLFASGVSRLFVDIVQDMIELVIIASPRSERQLLMWNIQFVYPSELEDRFVSKSISQTTKQDQIKLCLLMIEM